MLAAMVTPTRPLMVDNRSGVVHVIPWIGEELRYIGFLLLDKHTPEGVPDLVHEPTSVTVTHHHHLTYGLPAETVP